VSKQSERREHEADSLNDAEAVRSHAPRVIESETPKQAAFSRHYFRISALYGATDIGVRVMRRLDRARGRDTSLLDRACVKPLCRERFRDADLTRPSLARVSPLPIEQAVAALARVERGFGGLLVRQAS
jgi:hypothetical protein